MSDTTSYLCGKDNVSALKILRAGDFSGHCIWIASREQVMEVGQEFICAMYGHRRGTTVGEARYRLYTVNFGKLLEVTCHHL